MNRRLLLIPLALIALGVAFLVAVTAYVGHWASQPLPLDEEITVVVAPGMAFAEVVAMLEDLGAVEPWPFSLRAQQLGWQKSVQSGEYGIVPGETADGLLRRLVRGDVLMHSFRIVEGSTVARLLQRLDDDEQLHFDLAGANAETLMQRLGLLPGHAEGRFFPDTYLFPRGYRASELLRRAHAEMERQLDEAWRGRDVDLDDPYQALILASLVEKETAVAEDRGKVAGVFVRRLALDMRLQSDPTVIYGLGDAFDGDLTRAHLSADGDYNTYRRKGLPPTPIALPSRAAILAAMHPEDGDALYFVSRGDGTSEFSATLADHNAAVRRYQLR